MRHRPSVITAHSACWCQWSSRTPPGPSRMLTPETASEMAKSAWVTSRAQPPAWTRLWAVLKEDQNRSMPLTSVAGGSWNEGSCAASAGFWGPGLLKAWGVALMRPSAGRSGLPNTPPWADAAVAAAAAPPAMAPAASRLRLERGAMVVVSISALQPSDNPNHRAALAPAISAI